MTKDEKIDLINYLGFLNINRKMEQWVTGFDARLLWFIIIAGVAWYVLARTQIGNWIYATGDNKESARANGVPVNRVKVGFLCFRLSARQFLRHAKFLILIPLMLQKECLKSSKQLLLR